jgi:hypothetical protein
MEGENAAADNSQLASTLWIKKKRRPLIPVISLYKLSQRVKSSQKGNACRDKRINSSLYIGGIPYIDEIIELE